VPTAVKDIFNTYDYPTGMGSPIIEGYTPGNDARVVSDIRLDGGIVMGKTVTAEFAVHHPGPTVNPHDVRRTPGTSSSGAAAAVAARMVPVALSSQTAASTIRPASYCGIHGYKPSFGLVPRTAMLKTTDTLDTVAFMARSVADLRLMFEVCRVRGHNYPVSEAALNDRTRQSVEGRKWRVGVVSGSKSHLEAAEAREGLARLADALAEAGCEVAAYALPAAFDEAHDIHEHIYRRALAYYFKLEWQSNEALFSEEMRAMITAGLAITPEAYEAAVREQVALRRLFDEEAKGFDVLIGLAADDEAPVGLNAPDTADHSLIWTMVGAPAIALPKLSGRSGLPIGVQVVARRFDDYKLLAFAELLDRVAAG
jgi:Asp-tRNA(Asn)/Glu-tRNA(Gln) amidotransferase A subunit family amidase